MGTTARISLEFAAVALVGLTMFGAPTGEAVRLSSKYEIKPRPMPEFPYDSAEVWVNSEPMKAADLLGNVVLLEIWTTA